MRTHQLEGRKREEWVGELRNMGGHKQGLTNWRGGRGRSELVSLETGQGRKEEARRGGEGEGGGRGGAWKNGRGQTRKSRLVGRRREEWVGEIRNMAHCKQGLSDRRGG